MSTVYEWLSHNRFFAFQICAIVGGVSVAILAAFVMPFDVDAHYEPGADTPWFFERTVHIESGGKTSAGIIWNESTIITTQHGLHNQTDITVRDVHGEEMGAVVVHADIYSDVAVIAAFTGMPQVEMSAAGPGDAVYAVGHPSGRPYAVTGGIISSVDRGAPVTIQHDAAVFTGNSGGPLFDHMGGLVGMNSASDDLAFAIPHRILSTVVESVRTTGTYTPGCLGVMLDGDTVRTVRERVAGVFSVGDVIVSVDGKEPYHLLYDRQPGDVVNVVMEDRTVLVQLGGMGEWFGVHTCLDHQP